MKILIVDDESLDLFIAKTTLGSEYQVEGFTSVDEAVKWAGNHSFDAVLIDYYLEPGTNAPEALAALRKACKDPIRNAFVLSSYVDHSQLRSLTDAGFSGVIGKPVSLDAVRARIGEPR